MPTDPFHRQLDLSIQGSAQWNKWRSPGRLATHQLGSAIFKPSFLRSFQPPYSFLPSSAQPIHTRINCILKDSSYDTPLSNILMLTILASNASSSSTKLTQDIKGFLKTCNGVECKVIRQYGTTLWNYSAIRLLLHFIANLIFPFRAEHTGTKRDLQADRRLANWVRRSSDLYFFILFSRLVPSCQIVSMFCLKLQIP
ncbi:hypothetical protein H5410_031128 [Solanum commersonii]|uniref:Uncharacterized protein n=1 Tax=Solanum commersonii TaxID=4109 RepID=A0A9J5YLE1_SOLCO|nr:hypothetical protein H5410_031128 [Solanum commersonii]